MRPQYADRLVLRSMSAVGVKLLLRRQMCAASYFDFASTSMIPCASPTTSPSSIGAGPLSPSVTTNHRSSVRRRSHVALITPGSDPPLKPTYDHAEDFGSAGFFPSTSSTVGCEAA